MKRISGVLVLEDGSEFPGLLCGAPISAKILEQKNNA